LRAHAKTRVSAQERRREQQSSMADLFAGHQAAVQEATIDQIVEEQKALASAELIGALQLSGPMRFSRVVVRLLQAYMLRETNIKDICTDAARSGIIENTWGGGKRKPHDQTVIKLRTDTRSG
jgi:predicted DsbA family dithiol-disulfide isomerase